MEDTERLLGGSRMFGILAVMSEFVYGKKGTVVDKLVGLFEAMDSEVSRLPSSESEYFYEIIFSGHQFLNQAFPGKTPFTVEALSKVEYSLKDVEDVCRRIRHYRNDNVGVYLSALVNAKIKDGDRVVLDLGTSSCSTGMDMLTVGGLVEDTKREDIPIDYLCMYLPRGTVEICGNVGNYFGSKMKGGKATVKGDSRHRTGTGMKGGVIDIEGSTGLGTGDGATGGKVYVRRVCFGGPDITCKAEIYRGAAGYERRLAPDRTRQRTLPDS